MPNHYDYDRLPAMHDGQDNKVMWDGIPSPYFVESFYQPLQNALGGVILKTDTLYLSQHLIMMLVDLDQMQFQILQSLPAVCPGRSRSSFLMLW